jgi:hypothetical protein
MILNEAEPEVTGFLYNKTNQMQQFPKFTPA